MINPHQIITAKQLIEKIANGDLKDIEWHIKDELKINNTTEFDKLHFKNITFEKSVKIGNSTIQYGLFFENCAFAEPVTIQRIKCNAYSHNVNIQDCNILFSNCSGNMVHICDHCDIYRGVKVINKCVFECFLVTDTKVDKSSSISVRNSRITNILDLSDVNSKIDLDSNEVNKLRVETCVGDFSIIKSTFLDWVQIWNLECPIGLIFNYNTFNDTVKISGSRLNALSIIGDTFQKKFNLENRNTSRGFPTYLNDLYIREATFVEVAELDGLGEKIDKIKIPISPKLIGTLKIENWKVGEVNINGINQNLKLILSQLFMKWVTMVGFTNYSDITFERCAADNINFKTDINSKSSIILAHADLGKTKFIEFDFNSFDFISLDNSSFNEIYTSNVVWFDENKLNIQDSHEDEFKIAKRTREVYRQLKQSLRSSGNQIDSLEFQAREMKAYRNELKKGKNYSFWDRVIMTVNMSNDYGLNWTKPTLIMIGVSLLFYSIMLPLFSTNLNYNFAKNLGEVTNTFEEWWNNFDVFWQLFNPTRKFSTVFGNVQSGWLQFLDLIHRVFLGIMIYQIIKGFRKLAVI